MFLCQPCSFLEAGPGNGSGFCGGKPGSWGSYSPPQGLWDKWDENRGLWFPLIFSMLCKYVSCFAPVPRSSIVYWGRIRYSLNCQTRQVYILKSFSSKSGSNSTKTSSRQFASVVPSCRQDSSSALAHACCNRILMLKKEGWAIL